MQAQTTKQMKSKLINFKVTDMEYTKLLARARRYFGGNLSELLRTAGLNYVHEHEDDSPEEGTLLRTFTKDR